MRKPRKTLVLTVEEAGQMIGLGRGAAYNSVRRGDIPSIRFGKRIIVPKVALEQLLQATVPKTVA